jgi:hypothetical protein
VGAVAFSPDGRLLAAAGYDGRAFLWDVGTARAWGKPLRHGADVRALAFSPDGRLLATGGMDASARLWHVATGQPVGPTHRYPGEVGVLAFSPDGRTLLVGWAHGDVGAVRFRPVPAPAAGTPELLNLWVQVLTGQELDEVGEAHALDAAAWAERRRQFEEAAGAPER